MKITALEVDGFGVWTDLRLGDMSEGLNVFYGPNEAGKTTLMQFVRSVLYGLAPERAHYVPPRGGGRPGGTIEISSPQGRFHIGRSFVDCARGGPVTIATAEGIRQGEHLLRVLLGEVDETTFNNVFAVGLRQLQELATLTDTAAASMLYSLSMGLDRISLVEVTRKLRKSRSELLDPNGGPSEIRRLFEQRDRLRGEIDELSTHSGRYTRIVAEHEDLRREATRLETELDELKSRMRIVQLAVGVRDRWQRRVDVVTRLEALGEVENISDASRRRYQTIDALSKKHLDKIKQYKQQREELREEAAGVKLNESLWRMAPRVEALVEQETWYTSLQSRSAELETEIGELESRLAGEQRRMGLQKQQQNQEQPLRISSRSLEILSSPARTLRDARRRLDKAKKYAPEADETSSTHGDRLTAALAQRNEPNLAEAIERLSSTTSLLRRRLQVDRRVEQMEGYLVELETQRRDLLDRQLMPLWGIALLGLTFIIGVILTVSWIFSQRVGFLLGVPAPLVGVAAIFAAWTGKYYLERLNARSLAACQKQVNMLENQIREVRDERGALDAQLPTGDGPVPMRLERAERELAALEELVPLEARRTTARQEGDVAARRLAQAKSELARAQKRWERALDEAGLPEDMDPTQVKDLLARGGHVDDIRRRLELCYEEFQQRTREMEAYASRVNQLADQCEVKLDIEHPIDKLRALLEQIAKQEDRLRQRKQLSSKSKRARQRQERHEESIVQLKYRRRELLMELGIRTEDDFAHALSRIDRSGELIKQRDELEREIETVLAGQCSVDEVAQTLDPDPSVEALEHRREQIDTRLKEVEAELQGRYELRGRLAEQLKAVTEDLTPASKQLDLAMIERKLDHAVQRWRTIALGSRIMDGIRKSYERDRQPETLKEASSYLNRLTSGRYQRLWTPLGEDSLLIDTDDERSLTVENLSQGTREQLFLALRLSLANCYAQRGIQLPVILDDVLVNFDNQRATAAADLLTEFSRTGQQLLIFTCHEHISELFRKRGVPVHRLPSREPAIEESAAPPKPRPRRRPTRKPKPQPVEPPVPVVAASPPPPPPRPEPIPAPTMSDEWDDHYEDETDEYIEAA